MTDFPLQIKGLNKSFGKNHIIKDMSFQLKRGQIYGFLGPNGSGKTTTIRMIVSLIAPDSGDVIIEGNNIRTNRKQALSKIGAIVEDPDLYGYLTGQQNLEHFARLSNQVISKERIKEVVSLVELEGAMKKKVKSYSLGMKQRLGIAVSLLHRPSVLILDEPTNGLDPKGIRDLRSYLQRLAKEDGVTLLVSSHQLSEIETLCDRAIVIKKGEVVDEISMSDDERIEQTLTVKIEAKPATKAFEILSTYGAVKQNGTAVELEKQSYEEIPNIVAALINEQVHVYGVTYQNRLEDAYFTLTEEREEEVS
ncbi:ABC transporter ATP-binding protein [Alkalihalobacillus sp. LMS6]|uniref:ABC transporter ATP-binding protein n=1 Tax=Alkalihalobacillus sp. LMS6 TaxID=2924034 RepID=UPI0020D1BCC8|nr:ABC transporter ATP-binding protein [Alkalihalobacillus sp. LMS6]UTR07752.1 ABC transporter ATP-binding protein [Alkalihalobacillus sp. LMS6]